MVDPALVLIMRAMKEHGGRFLRSRADYNEARRHLAPLMEAGLVSQLPGFHRLAPGFELTPEGVTYLNALDNA
jgi:DNA-binding IclR family transcriptional regulator